MQFLLHKNIMSLSLRVKISRIFEEENCVTQTVRKYAALLLLLPRLINRQVEVFHGFGRRSP